MCSRLEAIGRHISAYQELKTPIKVTVTGGAGNIGYALVFMIGQGRMFGPNQPVDLTLLEIPQAEKALNGVLMELKDSSLPLISKLSGATDYKTGFSNCQVAILVGAKPRGPGMERSDLLGQNGQIFKGQGEALNQYADKNCKVVVVGNPANTNAMIASYYAPSIPRENFTALTRLDQNRAEAQIADKVNCHVSQVKNIIIWGNHSVTQYPDVNHATITNFPQNGISSTVIGAVGDLEYLQGQYCTTVAKRGAAIIEARKLSSAASAANAVCDHIHDWLVGTAPGQVVSMAVMGDGSYGMSKDVCFSYPVTCQNGVWKIVQGLHINKFSQQKLETTQKELLEERTMALDYLNKKK
ncbi:Lactate dehydrogenase/glycoside hydrolase, family 4, C-terminal [Pseudocohnilembus persalinus]|uniref:Malate dehydrogenase n=1 Tax=Pseudocohnilembus persalinus TaxID=266149 RepID=A0A0V0R5U0_PSEPJ|nr:Lactate dehydrogenase/glycoside hydrolase, family 4, C-terminal [Pseudocohnilembus persalinus]|eukprot:KRX09843.1 Lactate dehydrogenase/glycoside hydrolase, family 4, C-terminal [Pseudocohnilembus persalinus]